MDDFLRQLADHLILFGVLGLIVLIAPAMLLALAFKRRGLPTILTTLGLFFCLGVAGLGITIDGLLKGEVLAWSRSIFTVSASSSPWFYWLSAVAFLAFSVASIIGSLWLAVKNIMRQKTFP
jgi:hypothetical protein